MKRLRHLFLGENYKIINGEKLRLDGLNELETLEGFNSKHACAADIPKLTNLQKLNAKIYDNESLSVIANHISNNESQQLRETSLRIYMWNISSLVEEGPSVLRKLFISHSLVHLKFKGRIGCNLPCYEPGFCKNLITLSLSGSEIEEDVMETLGKFPMLSELYLARDACMGREMIFHANAFQQLRTLIISGLSNLEIWRVDEGAMPNLSSLGIDHCMKLVMMPDGLRNITTLQKLNIFETCKAFNDRLRVPTTIISERRTNDDPILKKKEE